MAIPLRTSWKGSLKRRLVPVKARTVVSRDVNNLEWTDRGNLRLPVFQGLVSGGAL